MQEIIFQCSVFNDTFRQPVQNLCILFYLETHRGLDNSKTAWCLRGRAALSLLQNLGIFYLKTERKPIRKRIGVTEILLVGTFELLSIQPVNIISIYSFFLSDLFFYPGEMMQPEHETAVNMHHSSSSYEEANPAMATTARQQSYYEAIRRPNTDGINIANSASTAHLVDEVTCPKEFYQLRHHQRIHPPPIEEEEQNAREVYKNSKIISRGAYLILVAVCLVSVCLAIFCSVMTINMQKQVEDMQKNYGQRGAVSSAQGSSPPSVICLPCDDIKQGPFPEDNPALVSLEIRIVNETEICCANRPEQVSIIFDLVSCSILFTYRLYIGFK